MVRRITSIRLPLIDQPKSSAAMRAASTEPRPEALASGPFLSTITPILMTSPPKRRSRPTETGADGDGQTCPRVEQAAGGPRLSPMS